jgi:hypothetical protein
VQRPEPDVQKLIRALIRMADEELGIEPSEKP